VSASPDYICTQVLMDTPVTIHVPHDAAARVEAAFEWFQRVEACCSRFDPRSELMQLIARTGEAVPASAMLFEAVRFALVVADASGGAFDPTVGHTLETRGFNREHRTGAIVSTPIDAEPRPTFRDVRLDETARTIMLQRPLILDLGAVAKGLAIDMAAAELKPVRNFAIDAGGDLFLGGRRPDGVPWSVGIRHPRAETAAPELIETWRVSDAAVCTSGDYERPGHIIDARSGQIAGGLASVTVVAPTAMAADALATAAFVLGPVEGLRLCEELGVDALMLSPACDRYETRGMRSGQYRGSRPVLQDTQRPADDHPGGVRRDRRPA
jgi:thiamine biosynthesis lipoprotein